MKIIIESTTKITDLSGVPARVWEGQTDTGIKVHVFITRIAINKDEPDAVIEMFRKELEECKAPSAEVKAYPLRMIL